MSVNKWMDKQTGYIHAMEYYSDLKKNYWMHLQQHGWILKIVYKVKKAKHKKVYTAWFIYRNFKNNPN